MKNCSDCWNDVSIIGCLAGKNQLEDKNDCSEFQNIKKPFDYTRKTRRKLKCKEQI